MKSSRSRAYWDGFRAARNNKHSEAFVATLDYHHAKCYRRGFAAAKRLRHAR